jgi:poly-gamma-glutamate synthesis protein (capsule biosynthesis protein)
MPTLGLTGDVMLGRKVDERQRRRAVEAVWDDLLERLRALDRLVINLECCLSIRGDPWTRTNRRFHCRADPDWAIPALKRAGADVAVVSFTDNTREYAADEDSPGTAWIEIDHNKPKTRERVREALSRMREAAAEWSRERMRSLSEAFGTAFECDGRELVFDLVLAVRHNSNQPPPR